MSGFKGTPGPWVASKSDRSIGPVIKDDDQSYGMILPVAWVEFDGKPGHHQANANLIAAAPELIEALKDMLSGWKYIREQHGDLYGVGWDRAQQKAELALSKALGQ